MTTEVVQPALLADWQAAEFAAAVHLRGVGFVDAATTVPGADGGIDVESAEAAAQVKFYATPVGRPDVQQLKGAAHDYRTAVFYSTGGYTREAMDYADRAEVALFSMDGFGRCTPLSRLAHLLTEPSDVADRERRLTELRAERYRYAGKSLESDAALYGQYLEQAKLIPAEAQVCAYVLAQTAELSAQFNSAVSELRLTDADDLYRSAERRLAFLSNSAFSKLCPAKTNLDDAAREGWLHDSSQAGDVQLHGAVASISALIALLNSFLVGWEFIFDDGLQANSLVDEQSTVLLNMLVDVAIDRTVLDEPHFDVVVHVLRGAINGALADAEARYSQVVGRLISAGLNFPRELTASIVRARFLWLSADAQLEAAA